MWVYNLKQGPKAHRQSSQTKYALFEKSCPRQCFDRGTHHLFQEERLILLCSARALPLPPHICSVLALSLSHKVSDAPLALLACSPIYFCSTVAQIPVVNKVLAVCSLLIQPCELGKYHYTHSTRGERGRETKLWHSRDWTPPSQPILPIYALILLLSLSTQFFTWEECQDTSRVLSSWRPSLQLQDATISHSCGPKWHQFLKKSPHAI